ncbi:GIY-YIG catalytic domain protein [Dokdonia sp. MED134]|uniref:GIY-YIG nuclease family protein n=1 Tax=Dokdonia sp. MED134 TaxID=313590 RepID=UPI000068CFE9|nr:GIY-YIG nuclease family protein [Dokdonia sp. MED134]AIN49938.1 GIY-YIG catalytic domain protein [Dokdonia sp. MED134]
MAIVYILYSENLDRYYIGSCLDLEQRIQQHILNNKGFTARAQDWKIFFKIINLEYQQARRIEKHIKNMKSKTYLVNLKKYDEITQKLIQKYK